MIRRAAPLLVLVLAAGFRFAGLGRWSLDGDEVYSWFDVQTILAGEDWPFGARAAPLGYLLMAGSVGLLGLGEWTLRLVPATASVVAVAAVLWLRRDASSRATALVAGGLMTLSPWLQYFGQTARFYAPLLAFATCATLWMLPGPGRRPWLAWSAWIAAVLCHPSALLLAPAILAPWLVPPVRGSRVQGAVAAGALVVSGALLLDDGALLAVVRRVVERVDPGQYRPVHVIAGLGYNLGPMVGLMAAVGLVALVRRRDARLRVLAVAALVPPATVVLAAAAGFAMHQRYAMAAVPAALLLAAEGLVAAGRRAPALAVAAGMLLLLVPAPRLLAYVRDGNRHDLRGVAATLVDLGASPDDLVVVDEHATLELYLHRHAGFAGVVTHEAPIDARRRHGFLRNRRTVWLALKVSRMRGAYGEAFLSWVRRHFDEVTAVGPAPPPLVRHDNRYLVLRRSERLRAAPFEPGCPCCHVPEGRSR